LLSVETSALSKLVRSPSATVEEGALLVAKDAYPSLDVGRYLAMLDDLAAGIRPRLEAVRDDPIATAKALGDYLFLELGFRGNDHSYYDVKNSYLNQVLESKRGIPLTLAIVILAIARRCDVDAEGIMFPGHFLVRIGGSTGCYIDPFYGARVLGRLDLEILLKRALGRDAEVGPEHLAVADCRAMLIRMLNNLRGIFSGQGDHARGMLVCDRLVDLDASPMALRDRGLCALAQGAYEAARDDLSRYLAARPDAGDRASIERALHETHGQSNLH
jgi:regulator of sirC expression with transglutaminase-like and TPR domain